MNKSPQPEKKMQLRWMSLEMEKHFTSTNLITQAPQATIRGTTVATIQDITAAIIRGLTAGTTLGTLAATTLSALIIHFTFKKSEMKIQGN